MRIDGVAVSHPQVVWQGLTVVSSPALQHAVSGPGGLVAGELLVIVRTIPVGTPLPNITHHIM